MSDPNAWQLPTFYTADKRNNFVINLRMLT